MWPFTGRKRDRDVDPSLVARLDDLERRVERIDIEWSEWFDKFRRLYARLAKRVHDDERRENTATEPANGSPALPKLNRPINPLAEQLLRGMRPPGA